MLRSVFLSLILAFSLLTVSVQSAPVMAGSLIMFDSKACYNCRLFKAQMAGKYRRSALGKKYKLDIVSVHSSRGARYEKRYGTVTHTPTFVLVKKGRVRGRFVGYRGRKAFMHDVRSRAR